RKEGFSGYFTHLCGGIRFGLVRRGKKHRRLNSVEESLVEMASEMVKAATSEKLKEMDWAKNIEICELVAQDPGKAKDVIKSIKKCIGSRSKNAQLYAVMLLEMLMNNCGEPIHKQVIDNGLLPILVKIVKKKVTSFSLIVGGQLCTFTN
uniref:VHS domain-containing protein n=1 Tax=Aegilops tauschii subsp. strangulata TaxID=200361 RepID=A0A453S2I7_AEGTS